MTLRLVLQDPRVVECLVDEGVVGRGACLIEGRVQEGRGGGGGDRAGDEGIGEWRSLDSSSVGNEERISERRASLRRSSRLVSTVVVWLATNSKVFAPETMSLWKFE